MKKTRTALFYFATLSFFSVLIYWIIQEGENLEQGRNIASRISEKNFWTDFVNSIQHNLTNPFAILLAQVIVILFVARLFSWISRKIGQPTVVGEIAAGIVLGPSVVGFYFPELSAALFPESSLSNLTFLSQVGLIMFMFVVGMELDLNVMRNKAHEAVVISHASIIIPFALGVGFAYFIYSSYAPEGVQFLSFSLFIGIAMSITAFPVLARIVQERNIHKTKLGSVVITCAAADDITAWCLLAAVIAIVQAGSFLSSLYIIALSIIYVFFMIKMVRPFLKRIGDLHTSPEKLSKSIVAIFFVTLMLSAFATEIIGIHALFGAFMAGAIMPNNVKFRNLFIEKVEDIATVLLLPLFFVFTGLRTEIGLLNDAYSWKIAGLVIAVAVTGKFLGSAIAAKFVGQSWKDSLTIGALMNTRGLMELIVLNIGYDLGILTPEIFAMMVIMALVTTFMTGPLLDFINWAFKAGSNIIDLKVKEADQFKILLSFSNPEVGRALLRLSSNLIRNVSENIKLTALSLAPVNELHQYNIEESEKESLSPVIEESKKLNLEITTLFKVSNHFGTDIIDTANTENYNLLLIGTGYSIYEGTILGKMLGLTTRIMNPGKLINTVTGKENLFNKYIFDELTHSIIMRSQIPVGILIDKHLYRVEKIFVPLLDPNDTEIIKYVNYFLGDSTFFIIFDPEEILLKNNKVKDKFKSINKQYPNHIQLYHTLNIDKYFLNEHDLIIISLRSWKKLLEMKSNWISNIPSSLIISE